MAGAADSPEEVYAKFHAATLAGDLDTLKRYGTSAEGAQLEAAPIAMKQMMIDMMKAMTPRTYVVESRSIEADGNRATLQLSTMRQANGKATLVKENGEWKVKAQEWGDAQQANTASAKPKPQLQASLAPISSAPVQGEVKGARFLLERAYVEQHDILVLRQGSDYFADQELVLFLFLKAEQKLDGLTLNVAPETGGDPQIHVKYKVQGKKLPESEIFMHGYLLRLEFGTRMGNSIPAKIELQVPTQPPTRISGSFTADVK